MAHCKKIVRPFIWANLDKPKHTCYHVLHRTMYLHCRQMSAKRKLSNLSLLSTAVERERLCFSLSKSELYFQVKIKHILYRIWRLRSITVCWFFDNLMITCLNEKCFFSSLNLSSSKSVMKTECQSMKLYALLSSNCSGRTFDTSSHGSVAVFSWTSAVDMQSILFCREWMKICAINERLQLDPILVTWAVSSTKLKAEDRI